MPTFWIAQPSTSSATRRSFSRAPDTRNQGQVPAAGSCTGATSIPPALVIADIVAHPSACSAWAGEPPVPYQ